MARKSASVVAILLLIFFSTAKISSQEIRVFENCDVQASAQAVSHLVVRSVPVDKKTEFPGTTDWVLEVLEQLPPGDILVTVSVREGLSVDRFYLIGSSLTEQGTYCKIESSKLPFGEIVNSAIKVWPSG